MIEESPKHEQLSLIECGHIVVLLFLRSLVVFIAMPGMVIASPWEHHSNGSRKTKIKKHRMGRISFCSIAKTHQRDVQTAHTRNLNKRSLSRWYLLLLVFSSLKWRY